MHKIKETNKVNINNNNNLLLEALSGFIKVPTCYYKKLYSYRDNRFKISEI